MKCKYVVDLLILHLMNFSWDQLDKWTNVDVKIAIVLFIILKNKILNFQLELTKVPKDMYCLTTPWYTYNMKYDVGTKKEKELEKYILLKCCLHMMLIGKKIQIIQIIWYSKNYEFSFEVFLRSILFTI